MMQFAEGVANTVMHPGLRPWPQTYYALRNQATGMYLAAHADGQLVAEDDTTNHHDLVWKIFDTPGGGIALTSCHGKFLTAPGGNVPNNTATQLTPDAEWHLERRGGREHSLRSRHGTWLSAVPPVDDKQAVFLASHESQAENWDISELPNATGLLSRLEGAFF